jgi:hypothetical protein
MRERILQRVGMSQVMRWHHLVVIVEKRCEGVDESCYWIGICHGVASTPVVRGQG